MKCIARSTESLSRQLRDYKPKPYIFPPDMIILQDTREQLPLFGPRLPKGMVLCSATLENGDYSLKGMEDKVAIERKGISDLLSYCTSEREKTKRKMERFKKMEWVGLVIEARESEVNRPYVHSNISPEVIRQSLVSFSIRYGIHVYISDMEHIQKFVIDHLIKFWKIKHEI